MGDKNAWPFWKTFLLMAVLLFVGVPIAALTSVFVFGYGSDSGAKSSDRPQERRYRGRYADAVEECVAKIAGWPENEDNTRHEFMALFDPSRASVDEQPPWSDDGVLRAHVRVAIPRVAQGYLESRNTHRPLDDEVTCSMFRRGDVRLNSYGHD